MRTLLIFAVLLGMSFLLSACGATSVRIDSSETASSSRNQQLAAELTSEATHLLATDPQEAMKLLRQAIEADLFHGPAHNNMGVILLNQGNLYDAAEEFDWARRLMPGHPDPRINLGLALERGGKIDDAIEAYSSAIEVYPGHLPAIQALARIHLSSGRDDDSTDVLLQEIMMRGTPEWRAWAIAQSQER